MVETSKWIAQTKANPDHSNWYIERFRTMAAEGKDLNGEARLIDAMAQRNSRILDAGCGPGRTGGALHLAGHDVVGADVDPALIAAAEVDHPGPTWLVSDLAELDLPSVGISEGFDLICCVGNVMTFLAASTRQEVLRRLGQHLNDGGRIVTGFGSGRDYEFSDYFAYVKAAGLKVDQKFSSFELHPFTDESDFLVAILSGTS